MTWARFCRWTARARVTVLNALAFLAPFAVSLAANITEGLLSRSLVRLCAGVVIPILLMIAIEVSRRVQVQDQLLTWVLRVAVAFPVVVAAGFSWLDTTSLLLAQYPHPWWLQRVLCFLAPLATDGLAVVAVLVLHRQAASVDQGKARERDVEPTAWGPASSVPPPAFTPAVVLASPAPTLPVSCPAEDTELLEPTPTPPRLHSVYRPAVDGWTHDMAAVPALDGQTKKEWVRARARALPDVVQSRRTMPALQEAVERAELAAARAMDPDPDSVPSPVTEGASA